jgi:hypothetical protein
MQLIAHTPHGILKGKEVDCSESEYEQMQDFLEKIGNLSYITFELSGGEKVYFSKGMIGRSVFVLKK